MGADRGGPDNRERAALKAERRALHARIEDLKREQDYLLFQKTMYENDSKYLVLDTRKKTGHLKYKNRVLKDFRFQTSKNFPVRSLRPGMLTLTEKIEGKKDRHALVFGKTFVVRWKRHLSRASRRTSLALPLPEGPAVDLLRRRGRRPRLCCSLTSSCPRDCPPHDQQDWNSGMPFSVINFLSWKLEDRDPAPIE